MSKAKYQNAYETLKTEILGGKYSSGSPFPSVVAASRRFSISRLPCEDIARQAFAFLRERIGNPEMPSCECYLSAPLVVRGSTILRCESK